MHEREECVLQCVAVCCSILQCVAVCCSVLQCVAVCCCELQCVAVCCSACERGRLPDSVCVKEESLCTFVPIFFHTNFFLDSRRCERERSESAPLALPPSFLTHNT